MKNSEQISSEEIFRQLRKSALKAKKTMQINALLVEAISFRKQQVNIKKEILEKFMSSKLPQEELKILIKEELIKTNDLFKDYLSAKKEANQIKKDKVIISLFNNIPSNKSNFSSF